MEKKHTLVPAITTLDSSFQTYVYLTHRLQVLNAERTQLLEKRTQLAKHIERQLKGMPNTKQTFVVPQDQVVNFGDNVLGLRLNKRKRDAIFNGKTFGPAVVDSCLPVFRKFFKQAVADQVVTDFAESLASEIWSSRASTTKFEIVPIFKPDPNKPKPAASGNKRKQQEDDEEPRESRVKVETMSSVDDPDDDF